MYHPRSNNLRLLVVGLIWLLTSCIYPPTSLPVATDIPASNDILTPTDPAVLPMITNRAAIVVVDSFLIPETKPENLKEGFCPVDVEGQYEVGGQGTVNGGKEGHGNVMWETFHQIVKNHDPALAFTQVTPAMVPGGVITIEETLLTSSDKTKHALWLVALDIRGYNTSLMAGRIREVVDFLSAQGIANVVINMSFALVPCNPSKFTGEDIAGLMKAYQQRLNEPAINDFQAALTEAAETGDVAYFAERLDEALASDDMHTILQAEYLCLSTTLSDPEFAQKLTVGLEFTVDGTTGVLTEESVVNIERRIHTLTTATCPTAVDFFADPLNDLLVKLRTPENMQVINVAAAGNDGLLFPYAPALWFRVLSVTAPKVEYNRAEVAVSDEILQFVDEQGKSQWWSGSSFSTPRVSWAAALYLLSGEPVACAIAGVPPADPPSLPSSLNPPMAYKQLLQGQWLNLPIDSNTGSANAEYCQAFPDVVP